MKRVVIIFSVLSMVFGIVAFDCSSSEMNAAKMYMADNVKKYDKAKEQLNLELTKNPNNDEAYFLLGKIDGIQGQFASMNVNYNKSLSMSQKFKKEIDGERAYYWQQAFNRGVAFYNRAMKLKADSSISVYGRALSAFEESSILLPDTLVAVEYYVYTAINMGKLDLIEAPLKTLTAKSKKADNVVLLGKYYTSKGDQAKNAKNEAESKKYYSQAIDLLNSARTKYPNDNGLMETLAAAYANSGRIDEAKASFSENVKVQPNNKALRYNYGTILLNVKDYPASEEQLKKAIELDPNYLDAMYNLAVCYVKWSVDMNEKASQAGQVNSDYKEKAKLALPLLNKYLEKKPDDAAVWELLAQTHTLLGNQKEAEEAFKKADKNKK